MEEVWEYFCDEVYYHTWRVRRKTERGFNDGYSVVNGEEAKMLCAHLNRIETALAFYADEGNYKPQNVLKDFYHTNEPPKIVKDKGQTATAGRGPRMTEISEEARELSAKLLPHTTSVHNVELIAQALDASYQRGMNDATRWISTSEHLPEKPNKESYEYVECLIFYRGEVLMRPWNCEHLCWDDSEHDDFFCEATEPTHWLPLPQPPKENEK